jgi:MoxR-like ATPase
VRSIAFNHKGEKELSDEAISALTGIEALKGSVAGVVIGHEEIIHQAILAVISGHHMVIVGPPGEAKSLTVMEIVRRIGGAKVFKYQFSQFSTPDHVIGPVSIRALRERDQVVMNTEGRLADCHFFVAEEIFKAGREIHDHLLLALNEREVVNPTPVKIPLRSVLATSNEFPQGEEMAAMRDRIAIRMTAGRPPANVLRSVLTAKNLDRLATIERPSLVSIQDLDILKEAIPHVDVPDSVLELLMEIGARLASANLSVSTRRFRWALDLIRANALLRASLTAKTSDLEVVKHVFWEALSQQRLVGEIVNSVLGKDIELISSIAEMRDSVVQYYKDCMMNALTKDQEVNVRADAVTRLRELHKRLADLKKSPDVADDARKLSIEIEGLIDRIVSGKI